MATYVMSDIHGDYERYRKMLQLIRFKDTDTLYILGDIIDRGSNGIKILQDMMMRPNVYPILGNHEYMASLCMEWLLQEVTEDSIKGIEPELMQGLTEWMNVGGSVTIKEFHALTLEEREDIIDYLSEFSLFEEVKAGGRDYILVHAGLENFRPERHLEDYDLSEFIFHKANWTKVYFPDKYLVTGHVPTHVAYAQERGLLSSEVPKEERKHTIFIRNNNIFIDCGCMYGGQLGCLCLDTMEEFYV
ncbi:MAG: fructose-bisphosphatase class III [Lachnospiraceae bacterium]|nr:fructose-bisphosphatase class III [Lachnospiraceae bacterium]